MSLHTLPLNYNQDIQTLKSFLVHDYVRETFAAKPPFFLLIPPLAGCVACRVHCPVSSLSWMTTNTSPALIARSPRPGPGVNNMRVQTAEEKYKSVPCNPIRICQSLSLAMGPIAQDRVFLIRCHNQMVSCNIHFVRNIILDVCWSFHEKYFWLPLTDGPSKFCGLS